MGRFIIRRLVGMVIVMFAVSRADVPHLQRHPQRRPRRPDGGQELRRRSRSRRSGRSGASTSRSTRSTRRRWRRSSPATSSPTPTRRTSSRRSSAACRARSRWRSAPRCCGLRWASRSGCTRAMRAGRWSDTLVTVLALDRRLDAGVLARRARELLPRLQGRALPQRRLLGDRRGRPVGVGQPHDPAVDRARDAVHRRLLARAALQRAGHDQRRLRAHGARQGPAPSGA